jgi:tetratricopeptide (TPR) repeat protein
MSKKILVALPLLFLIANTVSGQTAQQRSTPVGAIDGSIVIPTNQAMERHEVLLLSKDGEQVIAYTYNDLSGRYHFGNLSGGTYDVVVRIEGYEESRIPVNVTANRSIIVNMILTPKETKVIQTNPWDSSVVNVAELNRKYPRKAVEDFQKAAESKRKGDTAKAEELLEEVVKLSPDFFDAHNMLGLVYQGMARFRDAEKQYNTSRELSPESVAPLVNLAILYLEEAEANEKEGPLVTGVMYDDSLHILQDAVRMEPRNATIYYLLGVTFYRTRSYRYAEATFNEALSIDPHMGSVRLALANIYIKQQKWKDALNQFDTYLADNPKAADRGQVEAIRLKVIQQL